MKTFRNIVAGLLCLAALSSCDGFFKLDNMEGPNATISGAIIDEVTNQPIPIEANVINNQYFDWNTWSMVGSITYSGSLVVQEQDWKGVQDQLWNVRFDGTYTNNLVFDGRYHVSMKNLPCYDPANIEFTLAEGDNTVNFTTKPYGRIVDPAFSYDATAKKLVAKFKVELGDATKANNIARIVFCANTQQFVGASAFNLAGSDPGASMMAGLTAGTEYTLSIDTALAANAELFKYNTDSYKRPIYVRAAALVNGGGNNSTNLYNFTQIYKISGNNYEKVELISLSE